METLATVNPRKLNTFVGVMLQGQEKLDEALTQAFDGTRDQFLELTGEFVMSKYGR